jgi:hypothetical protein
MYAETLQFPHPDREHPDIETRPLTEIVDIFANGHRKVKDQTELDTVDDILSAVRCSLTVADPELDGIYASSKLPLDNLSKNQIANQVGYTIVGSECLERAGFDHFLAYANDSVWTMPVDADKGSIYMRHLLRPQFDAEVSGAFGRTTLSDLDEDVQTRGRALSRYDSSFGAAQANIDFEDLASPDNFVFNSTKPVKLHSRRFGIDEQQEITRYQEPRTLWISLYAPEVGRRVLRNFADFQLALAEQKPVVAAAHLEAMGSLYPEADARQPHDKIATLIDQLLEANQSRLAAQATRNYFQINQWTQDPRLKSKEAEAWNKLYVATGRENYRESAREAWTEAYRRSRNQIFRDQVGHRLAKLMHTL